MTPFPEDLLRRYRQFRDDKFLPNASEFESLATRGQKPEVMVISCCDSRVQPEAVFSSGPGDMFVVRNVANLIPPFETSGRYHGVSAALEFAILNLSVKHVVVMGHSGCGGITAALDQGAAQQTEARFISHWMSLIDDAKLSVLSSHQTSKKEEIQTALEFAGVATSIKNLRTFPFVAERETRGEIALHGAHFSVVDGVLSTLDSKSGKFVAQ